MNRRRKQDFSPNRLSLLPMIWIILFVGSFVAFGIAVMCTKNAEIDAHSQIKKNRDSIQNYKNHANSIQVQIDNKLGYFELTERMAELDIRLSPVSAKQVVVIPGLMEPAPKPEGLVSGQSASAGPVVSP